MVNDMRELRETPDKTYKSLQAKYAEINSTFENYYEGKLEAIGGNLRKSTDTS